MAGREGLQRKAKAVGEAAPADSRTVVRLRTPKAERPKQKTELPKEKIVKPRSEASMLVTIANRGYERAKGPETMPMGVTSKAYRQAIDSGPTKLEEQRAKNLKERGFKIRKNPAAQAFLRARAMASAFTLGVMAAIPGMAVASHKAEEQYRAEQAARAEQLRELRSRWDAYREQYAVAPGRQMLSLSEASPRLAQYVRSQGGTVTLGSHFVPYLGSSGPLIRLSVRDPLLYDPAEVLADLWGQKCAIAPDQADNAARAVGSYRALEASGQAWRSTIDAEFERASDPSHTGQSVTEIIATHLDWQAVQQHYHLSDTQRELLQNVIARMTPRDIYAIFLAELMPSDNGEVNIAVADTMLRRGGPGLLVRMTSLGDALNSSTPGQFTPYSFTEWAGIPNVGPLLSREGYRLLQIPKGDAINRMPDGQRITDDASLKFGEDLATSADGIESIPETEADVIFNGIGNLASYMHNAGVEQYLSRFVRGEVSGREFAVFFGMLHHEPSVTLAVVAHHQSGPLYVAVPHTDQSGTHDYGRRVEADYDALDDMRPAHDAFAEGLRHPPPPLP